MKKIIERVWYKAGCTAKIYLLTLLIHASFAFASKAQTIHIPSLNLVFKNRVDSRQMQLGETYHNAFGEEYTVRKFKYYISNVSLHKADGTQTGFPGNYLIDQDDSMSKIISIKAAGENLAGISFLIGVDSIYNVSGTQTGDLDPEKGMFWAWNSGYIMAKLEATSPVSAAPNNNATFHIGGFAANQKVSRIITLKLPAYAPGKILTEIVIEANANKWFSGVHNLPIADHAICTTPGPIAVQYADNYAEMFTAATVK